MWNLTEPGFRFRAAAPNHPEALLEEPQAFQAVGEQNWPSVFGFVSGLLPLGLGLCGFCCSSCGSHD